MPVPRGPDCFRKILNTTTAFLTTTGLLLGPACTSPSPIAVEAKPVPAECSSSEIRSPLAALQNPELKTVEEKNTARQNAEVKWLECYQAMRNRGDYEEVTKLLLDRAESEIATAPKEGAVFAIQAQLLVSTFADAYGKDSLEQMQGRLDKIWGAAFGANKQNELKARVGLFLKNEQKDILATLAIAPGDIFREWENVKYAAEKQGDETQAAYIDRKINEYIQKLGIKSSDGKPINNLAQAWQQYRKNLASWETGAEKLPTEQDFHNMMEGYAFSLVEVSDEQIEELLAIPIYKSLMALSGLDKIKTAKLSSLDQLLMKNRVETWVASLSEKQKADFQDDINAWEKLINSGDVHALSERVLFSVATRAAGSVLNMYGTDEYRIVRAPLFKEVDVTTVNKSGQKLTEVYNNPIVFGKIMLPVLPSSKDAPQTIFSKKITLLNQNLGRQEVKMTVVYPAKTKNGNPTEKTYAVTLSEGQQFLGVSLGIQIVKGDEKFPPSIEAKFDGETAKMFKPIVYMTVPVLGDKNSTLNEVTIDTQNLFFPRDNSRASNMTLPEDPNQKEDNLVFTDGGRTTVIPAFPVPGQAFNRLGLALENDASTYEKRLLPGAGDPLQKELGIEYQRLLWRHPKTTISGYYAHMAPPYDYYNPARRAYRNNDTIYAGKFNLQGFGLFWWLNKENNVVQKASYKTNGSVPVLIEEPDKVQTGFPALTAGKVGNDALVIWRNPDDATGNFLALYDDGRLVRTQTFASPSEQVDAMIGIAMLIPMFFPELTPYMFGPFLAQVFSATGVPAGAALEFATESVLRSRLGVPSQ